MGTYEPCVLGSDGNCTRWSHDHAADRPSVTDNARDEEPLAWCPGCGDRILTRVVRERGVCSECWGTRDDPWAAGRAETTTATTEDAAARLAAAEAELDRLCNGGRFIMSVPPREGYDSDLLIQAALTDLRGLLATARTETTSAHECDSGDFDRTICDCGAMHSYCTICGTRQDDCPHGATTATTEDAEMVIAEELARAEVGPPGGVPYRVAHALNERGLLATARTRPTRYEVARAIDDADTTSCAVCDHDWCYYCAADAYRKADAVLALLRGGERRG